MHVLLDSNVVLRLVEPKHSHHAASKGAIERLRLLGHEPAIVPQVIYEFWTVATRPIANNGLGMSSSEARVELAAMHRLFRFLRDERGVYTKWEQLIRSIEVTGKKAHDARLVAAMMRHGISHLLTFNTIDFNRYPSISTLLPDDVIAGTVI